MTQTRLAGACDAVEDPCEDVFEAFKECVEDHLERSQQKKDDAKR